MFDEQNWEMYRFVKLGWNTGLCDERGEGYWIARCSGCGCDIGRLTASEFAYGTSRLTFGFVCFDCEPNVCARCWEVVDLCECAFGPKEHPWSNEDEEDFHWEVRRSLVLLSISHHGGNEND